MVEIDGAHGEGGGQLVRMAVAVAAAGGVPVRIVKIRAPGATHPLACAGPADVLGAAQVAERGLPAEQLGPAAARMSTRDLQGAATLDIHAADRLPVFLALADGPSLFRASQLSSHAATAMWLLERLTAARFGVARAAGCARARASLKRVHRS